MNCVTSSKPMILCNGEPLEPIQPNCGLRQGNPLSPYLFVLCMERLAYMVEEATNEGKWRPVAMCRGGPKLSRLFFADNLILIAKDKLSNDWVIKDTLDSFFKLSGLKVKLNKSKVFFTNRIPWSTRRRIASVLGVGGTNDLGKYLGVPIVHSRGNARIYCHLVDKVQSRLSTWKAKLLNMASRATLIKSVTAAMPTHVMQTAWLSSSTCAQLDRLNRSFLWSTESKARKLHLVGWNDVSKSKKDGGLGIRETRTTNLALLAKVGWNLMTNKEIVRQDLFKKKYIKGEGTP